MIGRWYWIALGVALGVGSAVVLAVAIAQPSVEAWTAAAAVVIPALLVAPERVRRVVRRRRG